MRARNIKPGFFENEKIADLDPMARLLFIGLWCYADKEGRFEWRPKRIKALVFPYDNCDVECHLMSLHAMSFIYRYEVGGEVYGEIPKFRKHQNPHPHEAKSTLPEKPESFQCHDMSLQCNGMSVECNADSLIPDSLIPDVMNQNKEAEKTPRKSKPFKPPTPDEVGEYMLEIGYHGNPEQFCNHYTSTGWMINKNKMKDWKAAVRTWRGNDRKYRPGNTGSAEKPGAKAAGAANQFDTLPKPAGFFAGDFPDRSSEW